MIAAGDGDEAFDLIVEHRPDIVIWTDDAKPQAFQFAVVLDLQRAQETTNNYIERPR